MPASPRHTRTGHASPRLPCPTTLCLAEPCLPYLASPIQTKTSLAPPAAPRHTQTRLSSPRLPCPTDRFQSQPSRACQSFPCQTLPLPASPCLPRQTQPYRTAPCHSDPRLPCQSGPLQTTPVRAAPSLPRFKRHSMPNLALIALSRSLSTTWNKPNPHPALALLSGLPAPIPTCKPQRLIKLITSTVLN